MSVPFKFQLGHTVVLIDASGRHSRFYVREVLEDGWMLEPYDHPEERRYHSGNAVEQHYRAGRMRYEPWDDDDFPIARRRRLRAAFMGYPATKRLKAVRRLAFIKAAEAAMREGTPRGVALKEAPVRVLAERGNDWASEDTRRAEKAFERREERGLVKPGEYLRPPAPMKPPCERTMWGWAKRYVESGRSINALLDSDEQKGRRGSQLIPEQDEELRIFFKDHVKARGVFHEATGYRQLAKILKGKGLPEIGRKTFRQRLQRELDRKGLAQLERGPRAARRFGKVSDTALPRPLWAMHQVEIDHTLLNIKVVDDETGIDLGRPWLSACKDRGSTSIPGLHLSFLAPQWATLSRCLAHCMWPKDLSGIPSLKNEWLAGGVFDEGYTDRGMDFISKPGRWAAAEHGFELLNLPGYSPWLKGSLERWNREIKAEIMSYRDGITSFDNPEYKGGKLPTVTVSELKRGILEWVVDDYQPEGRKSLDDASPNDLFCASTDEHGPPRFVHDIDKLRRMTMVPDWRTIQNDGVEVRGFFYTCDELTDIRRRHGAPRKFLVLIDPWDTGYIELLDGKDWLVLRNRCTETRGVTGYRSELIWKEAAKRRPGQALTIDDYLRAMEALAQDAERVVALGSKLKGRGSHILLGRYWDLGQFLTPIPIAPPRYDPLPPELPGWVSQGGVLRPVGRPEPTKAEPIHVTHATAVVLRMPARGVAVQAPIAAPDAAPKAQPAPAEAARSAPSKSVFERLAEGGRARAEELGS